MKIFATIVAVVLILGSAFLIVYWSIGIIKTLIQRHKNKKEMKSKDLGEKGSNE